MNARKGLALFTVAAAAVAIAPVAHAADTASTTLSVVIEAGTLSISAPASASLGTASAEVGGTASAAIGTVTVADSRGSLLGWSVTAVTETATMSTGGSSPTTIPLTAAGPLSWATGAVTATGTSLLTGVSAGAGGFLNNTTPIPVAASALSAGGGTYTYNPTVTLTVPPNTAAGTYTVVVTQTVA